MTPSAAPPRGGSIGVMLPTAALASGAIGAVDAAVHAEAAGFDSVWIGDHLMTGGPVLDSLLVLATAAAATDRIAVGSGVLLAGMRPVVWLAKQVATLQHLTGDRFVLGVGSGGPWPDEWAAAGVPYEERGRRTDRALALLPALLAGDEVVLDRRARHGEDGPTADGQAGGTAVQLAPAATMPPVWVGGGSRVARRRAVEHGQAWFPSMVLPEDLAPAAAELAAVAAERTRPAPEIAVGLFGSLGPDGTGRERLAAGISGTYGIDPDRAAQLPLAGSAEQVAARLGEYRTAGADHLIVGLAGDDWRTQVDLLAEARARLPGAGVSRRAPRRGSPPTR